MKKNKMSEKDKKLYIKFFTLAALMIAFFAVMIVIYEHFPQYNIPIAIVLFAGMAVGISRLIRLLGSTSDGQQAAEKIEKQNSDPRRRRLTTIAIVVMLILAFITKRLSAIDSPAALPVSILGLCVLIAWLVTDIILAKKNDRKR